MPWISRTALQEVEEALEDYQRYLETGTDFAEGTRENRYGLARLFFEWMRDTNPPVYERRRT